MTPLAQKTILHLLDPFSFFQLLDNAYVPSHVKDEIIMFQQEKQ